MKAELKLAVKTANIANAKVDFARKVTEEWLKDSFEMDPETDSLKPKENFLKEIEDSLDKNKDNLVIRGRLQDVKNKLLDKVKEAPVRSRSRRASFSSTTTAWTEKGKFLQT
jgi:hypothetical protein